jgi:hypothetical protein
VHEECQFPEFRVAGISIYVFSRLRGICRRVNTSPVTLDDAKGSSVGEILYGGCVEAWDVAVANLALADILEQIRLRDPTGMEGLRQRFEGFASISQGRMNLAVQRRVSSVMLVFDVSKASLLCWLFSPFLLCGGYATAQSHPMDCTKSPKNHVHLLEGDQNSARHLQVIRKVEGEAPVDLQVCDADLTIREGKDDRLRITVDFENGGPTLAGEYLQRLEVTREAVNVELHLPKQPRAKVTVIVPATTANLQLNLVRGNLSFQTDRITGQRTMNIVSGHVDLLTNPDSYGTLRASVLMGSFHDHRKDGGEGHGMVSKSLSGTGKGSVEVNVVRGSLDVRAWD